MMCDVDILVKGGFITECSKKEIHKYIFINDNGPVCYT